MVVIEEGSSMVFIIRHPEKEDAAMFLTGPSMEHSRSLMQLRKAASPMDEVVEGMVIEEMLLQFSNALAPIEVIPVGIDTVVRFTQPWNAARRMEEEP